MNIGVLNSGGDSPGLNAVIEGVVGAASRRGWNVVGFYDGFEGLLSEEGNERFEWLTPVCCRGLRAKGGTILGTVNKGNFAIKVGVDQKGAIEPAVLEKTASRYGPVRVGFSGALTADELAETGLSAAVQSISAKEAHALLSGWDADGTLPPARRAAARAAVWEAFFRQDLALLPATLPDALRASSAALLTDFAAQDYTLLGTVLEFLANNSALPHAEALPGAWDAKAGTYTVTDASRAAVQTFLSVSPASGNDASLREP